MSKAKQQPTAAEYLATAPSYRFDKDKKPSVSTRGIWELRGADQNPDLGGSHYQPLIGYFEGTFEDVYNFALTKPASFGWGGFEADIKLINIIKIDSETIAKQQKLKEEQQQLEARLAEIKTLLP